MRNQKGSERQVARVMFEEMDLKWDLEQLEKVKRGEQLPIV